MINLIVRESESSLFPHVNRAYSLDDFERLAAIVAKQAAALGTSYHIRLSVESLSTHLSVVIPLGRYFSLIEHLAATLSTIGLPEEIEDPEQRFQVEQMWDIFEEMRGTIH